MQHLITQAPGMGAAAQSLGTPMVVAEGSVTHSMAAAGAKPSAAAGGKKGTGGGKGNKVKEKKLGKWKRMDKLGQVKNEGSRSEERGQ